MSLIKRVQITQIIAETPLAKTFVLQPLDNWNPEYKPGQFLTFIFSSVGGEKRRSYSISSTPVLNEQLSITVKKVDNGEFSRYLLDYYKEGDILFTTGINGFFCLPDSIEKFEQYFFLVAGSGITPAFSLIKTLLAKSSVHIVLIYSNRNESDTIFHAELVSLAQQYSERLVLHFLFSYKLELEYSRLSNTLLSRLLQRYIRVSYKRAAFYICGPLTYMQMVSITLISEGISRQNIKTESFDSTPRKRPNIPPDLSTHQVTISLDGEKHVFQAGYPLTILAAAHAKNIELPYSCNTGRCGSCVAKCTSGEVWMAYNEVLMDVEIEKGLVLTCQSYPLNGDVELTF